MTTRAATYSRYSSDQQRESSITQQQRNCAARAATEGWQIIAEFADAAISGSDNQRPQYVAMQEAARRSEFEVLVLDSLSRLTRDSMEQERVIRRLEFLGIRIVTTSDGYDSRSAARKVHRQASGMVNEIFLDHLRAAVHRGQKDQALQGRWNGGRPYGYRLRAITDPHRRDAHDQPEKIGTKLVIDPAQAAIVKDIFEQYANGASRLTIARDLNARGIASPGSTWKRKTRRASGWMHSAIRVILRNPLYTGAMRWNTSRFIQNPDTGKYLRRARPESEWVVNQVEGLRIVTDQLFQRVQLRNRTAANPDSRLKSGGKARYLLSGLMSCDRCGAHLVMADARKYVCSSVVNGGACDHDSRVFRTAFEDMIIGPIRADLKSPERVARMAKKLEAAYARRLQAQAERHAAVPKDLQDLDARIVRLRARLAAGDPDMPADELQAGIDRAEAKRRDLAAAQPETRALAKIHSMLPKAAPMYLRMIDQGLAGDARAAAKARILLRNYLGPITISTDDKGVWAAYRLNPAALIQGAGQVGRGDRI